MEPAKKAPLRDEKAAEKFEKQTPRRLKSARDDNKERNSTLVCALPKLEFIGSLLSSSVSSGTAFIAIVPPLVTMAEFRNSRLRGRRKAPLRQASGAKARSLLNRLRPD